MNLKIHNVNFNICFENKVIFDYIKYRFIGFISDNNCIVRNTSHYEIIETKSNKKIIQLIKDKKIYINNKKDYYIFNTNEIYLWIADNANYILYNKNDKKISVYIAENCSSHTNEGIAMQICDIISYILHANGIISIHASATTFGDDGVAFVGNSGSGKTSIALKMREAGEKILCDDILYLNVFTQQGIRNVQKIGLHEKNLKENFSYLSNNISHRDSENKERIDLYKVHKSWFINILQINKLVFVNSNKNINANIKKGNAYNIFLHILRNSPKLEGLNDLYLFNNIDLLIKHVECFELTPSYDVNKTQQMLYTYFNS